MTQRASIVQPSPEPTMEERTDAMAAALINTHERATPIKPPASRMSEAQRTAFEAETRAIQTKRAAKGNGKATAGMLPEHLAPDDWAEVQRVASLVLDAQESVAQHEQQLMTAHAALQRAQGKHEYVVERIKAICGIGPNDAVTNDGVIVRA